MTRVQRAAVVVVAVGALVVGLSLLFWACSQEHDRVVGKVTSVERLHDGVRVCVVTATADDETCADLAPPVEDELRGVREGVCVRMTVVRAFAIELEPLSCP